MIPGWGRPAQAPPARFRSGHVGRPSDRPPPARSLAVRLRGAHGRRRADPAGLGAGASRARGTGAGTPAHRRTPSRGARRYRVKVERSAVPCGNIVAPPPAFGCGVGGWRFRVRCRTGADPGPFAAVSCLSPSARFRWSGRRDSNPRPQPWQGCALPLSYSRRRTIARADRPPPVSRRSPGPWQEHPRPRHGHRCRGL